jgi:ribosomal-protein-alanine N-acetyltransferase
MNILESKRLLFRHHSLIDLEQYCAMEMDANVRRYVGGYSRSRDDAERKFRNGPLRKTSDRLGVWATVLKPDGPYIGRSGLYPHVQSGGRITGDEAALSFYIAREFWGQGFATEAAAALVKFGWEELKLSRIVATVQEGNDVSIHILKKLGFELISTEPGPRSFLKFALNGPA